MESGPDVAQFFLSGRDITCGTSLAAGASCAVGVVFSPKAIGTFHAQIALTDNSGGIANSTQVIALVGTGTTPAPVAGIAPHALSFGGIQLGTTSGTQQVTLLNTGSIALNIINMSIGGADAADFTVANSGAGQCTGGGNVAVQASCSVSVRFGPSPTDAVGAKSATLAFTDNAAGSPQVVTLSGTATSPPSIQLSPASLHFSPQSSGTASASQIVTVTNTSASPLAIYGLSISGVNAADFRQTANCPPSLGGGAFCTVSVIFEPGFQASASRTSTLNVADNASGSPQTVALSGSAMQAAIQIVPSSISFSGQQAGTASSPQTITVTNTGTGNLSFSSVAVNGGPDFIVGANTCTASQTPPGGSCTIQLTFSPACTNGAAARSANLTLGDNVPGSPQNVPLSGMATGDFCFAPAAGVTVNAGQTAAYTVVVNSPAGYKGSVSLSCANFPAASTCSAPASVSVPSQFAVSVATLAASGGVTLVGRGPHGKLARVPVIVILACVLALYAACSARPQAVPQKFAGGQLERQLLLLFLTLCATLWISACGGGGGRSDPAPASAPGTAAGTYAVIVTGTSPNTTGQVALTLTVK